MKIKDLEKTFSDTFRFISIYDTLLTKKYTKPRYYSISKEDLYILKKTYKSFNISEKFLFRDYKKMCIKLSTLSKEGIIISALKLAKEISK